MALPSPRFTVICACLLQVVLAAALALTHLPLCDEGFYGVPAHMFSLSGALRNPVLESAGGKMLTGVDRAFYWMAPMGMVLQGTMFKLLVQRGLSLVCGLGAVLLWYLALRHLVSERAASLAALFLATDFVFLSLASLGRSDMISLFFSIAALTAYLHWRERSLVWALAIANTACAISGMVHPNGGLAAVASLLVLVLYLDRKRLKWSHFGAVAACYGVLALAWGLYIAVAPDLFVAQFFGNVANRFTRHPRTLTDLLGGELTRYASAWGLYDAHGVKILRYLFPLSYLAAIVACVGLRDLRKRSGVLLLMFLAVSLSLVFTEGTKQAWYLVHLTPLFAALLSVAIVGLWERRATFPRTLAAAQFALVLLGIASVVYTTSGRNLQLLYKPMVSFLNKHVKYGDLVMARSELYFGLDCRTCLKDDWNLGEFSGLRPSYIVLSPDYEHHLAELRQTNSAAYYDIEARLSTGYREVFRDRYYRVLQRTE